MTNRFFDMDMCLLSLREKRPVFHSEADFQFALSWEIKSHYPEANVRLEYRPPEASNMHIDILIFHANEVIPIELKYKTAKLDCSVGDESFHLKDHSAQDSGRYDCLDDVQRLENLSSRLTGFSMGYTVWLTNDASYWKPASGKGTNCEAFSIHQSAQKHGRMEWAHCAGAGTIKGRETAIDLNGTYRINWKPYSTIGGCKNGTFQYAALTIAK